MHKSLLLYVFLYIKLSVNKLIMKPRQEKNSFLEQHYIASHTKSLSNWRFVFLSCSLHNPHSKSVWVMSRLNPLTPALLSSTCKRAGCQLPHTVTRSDMVPCAPVRPAFSLCSLNDQEYKTDAYAPRRHLNGLFTMPIIYAKLYTAVSSWL